jgi:hypothetical protein
MVLTRKRSRENDSLRPPGMDSDVDSISEGRSPKFVQLDESEEDSEDESEQVRSIKCHLPPHGSITFRNFQEYETHYNRTHVNRCITCRKNFPSDHFLMLHIAENHDPINEAKRDRGEKVVSFTG